MINITESYGYKLRRNWTSSALVFEDMPVFVGCHMSWNDSLQPMWENCSWCFLSTAILVLQENQRDATERLAFLCMLHNSSSTEWAHYFNFLLSKSANPVCNAAASYSELVTAIIWHALLVTLWQQTDRISGTAERLLSVVCVGLTPDDFRFGLLLSKTNTLREISVFEKLLLTID